MNVQSIFVAVLLAVVAVLGYRQFADQPTPAPQPYPAPSPYGPQPYNPTPYGPQPDPALIAQLRYAMQGPAAREDGLYLAAVFESAGQRLMADTGTAPAIKTGGDLNRFVERLGETATTGRTEGRYPGLPPALGAYFAQHLPTEGRELDATAKQRAALALQTIGASLREAVR